MRKITAVLLLSIFFACKYKPAETSAELRERLKKTMADFLYKNNHVDSGEVKYDVLDVVYYENPGDYVCEFKVHMHERNLDTTGMMSARISKDMTHVFRRY
ncbi:MAG TPA: hypothetical protein VG738_22740 [Chitinophagaceae bacterium]|nr:hypothetical protein [Chitinophagaceae bacterium]